MEECTTSTKIVFANGREDPFVAELQQQVRAYFQGSGRSQHWNGLMFSKSIFYLGGYGSLYVLLITHTSMPWLVWALLGFFAAGIGFNVGHDSIHGAYSKNRRLNRLLGHSFSLIGAHVYNWRILHNVIHHSYTNIAGADGDLHPVPFLRFYPSKEGLKPYHRFQHLYALPLYALTSLMWTLKKDFDHIFRKEHLMYEKPALPKGEFGELVAVKSLHYLLFFVLPIFVTGYAWWQVLAGFVLMHAVTGLKLALTFQLGHIVEGPDVHHLNPGANSMESWHRVQLKGTANFAPDDKVVNWLTGGLNYQIEHHLFPQTCHVHYPALAKIVKATAKKHGLPYHVYPTMRSALASHFRVIKAAGRGEASFTSEELAAQRASI